MLFFGAQLGYASRAWDPLSPGLLHIHIREPLKTLLDSSRLQQLTGPSKRSLTETSIQCLSAIRDLLSPLRGLERKMSHVPSSGLFFALLEDVGELVGSDKAWKMEEQNKASVSGGDKNMELSLDASQNVNITSQTVSIGAFTSKDTVLLPLYA
jgi:hypothetical protein